VILATGDSNSVSYSDLDKALAEPDTRLRLFGKPEVHGRRRMGVALARGDSVDQAREKARRVSSTVKLQL
jgi:phosphoribosylglycinamide formyltransferase 2